MKRWEPASSRGASLAGEHPGHEPRKLDEDHQPRDHLVRGAPRLELALLVVSVHVYRAREHDDARGPEQRREAEEATENEGAVDPVLPVPGHAVVLHRRRKG